MLRAIAVALEAEREDLAAVLTTLHQGAEERRQTGGNGPEGQVTDEGQVPVRTVGTEVHDQLASIASAKIT